MLDEDTHSEALGACQTHQVLAGGRGHSAYTHLAEAALLSERSASAQRRNSNIERLVMMARPRLKRALAWNICLRAPTEEGVAQVLDARERNGSRQGPAQRGRTHLGQLRLPSRLRRCRAGAVRVMARLQLGMVTQASAVPSRTGER